MHPVDSHEADFVVALLQRPHQRRMHLTRQLAKYLAQHEQLPPTDRPAVPCRTPSGLYHVVPWRLAKWLRHVLPAHESVIHRTVARIQQWQSAASSTLAVTAE